MGRGVGRVRAALLAVAAVLLACIAAPVGAAGSTAPTVEFRAVLSDVPPATPTSTTMAPADRVDAGVKIGICDVAGVAQLPVVPTTDWRLAKPAECVVYPDASEDERADRYFLGPAAALPVRTATPEFLSGEGWVVRVVFTKAGSQAWDRLAQQQFHQRVAITYRGSVVASPTVEPNEAAFRSLGGTAVISGDFTRKQARALATAVQRANGR